MNLSSSPGLCILPAFQVAGRYWNRSANSRHEANAEKRIDGFIRPGFPGESSFLHATFILRLIQLHTPAQLHWIRLEFTNELLQPVIPERFPQFKGADQAADLGDVAGTEAGRQLGGPQAALLAQGGEIARQVAAAPRSAGHGKWEWSSCSSNLQGSRIDRLAQQKRTAGW
ncbi:hypothetical protein [Vulcanococcus limneticus]|uniref:hypothetical protein n=1 Tax=Vulcanococcus limneticus TaxID=2170428 RepID=UPI00398C1098